MGLKLIEAGRASLIIANNPIMIALLSACFLGERLKKIQVGGILISVFGALIVISRGRLSEIFTGGAGWGELFIFCCVLSWVAYSLIGKKVMDSLSPLVSVTYSAIIGAAALFIPACGENLIGQLTTFHLASWLSVFYLGFFGTVLGFVWYYQGIKAVGTVRASQFINFVPVSAVILAFLILSENITSSLLIGGLFVLAGIYITNTGKIPFYRTLPR
jgi:drug/metabolite transporter (DMT)-like permease